MTERRKSELLTAYEILKNTVVESFQEIETLVLERRNKLLATIKQMKSKLEREMKIDIAIQQLRSTRVTVNNTITIDILDKTKQQQINFYDSEIQKLKNQQDSLVEEFSHFRLRCFTDRIEMAIQEIDLVKITHPYANLSKDKFILSTCKRGIDKPDLLAPRNIAVDNTHVFVSDMLNSSIKVLNLSNGEYIRDIGTAYLQEPVGVALNEDSIFITDCYYHAIFKFTIEGEYLISKGTRGRTEGNFMGPRGLTLLNELLYVCDCSNNRIQLFTHFTHELNFVRVLTSSYIIPKPVDIKIFDDMLHVLTKHANTIYILSLSGDLLSTVLFVGMEQTVIATQAFSIDAENNYIVTDWYGNCIRIFNCNGEMIHKLEHNIKYPYGVVVLQNNSLAVVCHEEEGCFKII